MAETAGIDFAWSKPNPAAVVNAGYSFVLGYLSNDPSKNMSAGLAAASRAAGLAVGVVWEVGATRVQSGAAGGTVDGATAETQANAIGYPKDSVIFFAVDYAAGPGDFAAIQAYANAFNSKTSRPVGIYGSYAVIEHFVTPGVQPVRYGWQTVAWSSGRISGKASIYQRNTHNHPTPAGMPLNGFDEDVLLGPAVPLWGLGSQPAPTPPPPPPPPPPADWQSIPDMAYGQQNNNVLHLQQFMTRVFRAYNSYTPTGFYGASTSAGVKEFQRRSGIAGGDGRNIGPQTKQALWKAGFRP